MKIPSRAIAWPVAVATLASIVKAQEIRESPPNQRTLWGWWSRDNDDNEENGNRPGGFFGGLFCAIFRCEDNPDDNPVSEIIDDILNETDGSDPIGEAVNASKGSDTPLRDFFAELLGQPGSETPWQDWIKEAYNRSDAPLVSFLRDLFDTLSGEKAQDFVETIFNGSTSPLQEAIGDWIGDQIFENLNCTQPAEAPVCAYSIDGNEGIWACRTFYNPFTGEKYNTTVCSPANYTLKGNDVCGSCDGTYPSQCPCTCDVNTTGANDGVLITLESEPGSRQCVNAKWAVTALNMYPDVECITTC
jgi:hypothetical protein